MATAEEIITDAPVHNGHCAGCAIVIHRVDNALSRHIQEEDGRTNRMEGQLGLLVKLVLAAITGIGGIAMLWIATMVARGA